LKILWSDNPNERYDSLTLLDNVTKIEEEYKENEIQWDEIKIINMIEMEIEENPTESDEKSFDKKRKKN